MPFLHLAEGVWIYWVSTLPDASGRYDIRSRGGCINEIQKYQKPLRGPPFYSEKADHRLTYFVYTIYGYNYLQSGFFQPNFGRIIEILDPFIVTFYLKNKGAYLFASLSGIAFVVSLASILSFISLYFYELPTHHCPFCILQKEYGYIG